MKKMSKVLKHTNYNIQYKAHEKKFITHSGRKHFTNYFFTFECTRKIIPHKK